MARVVRPGGRVVVLEITTPTRPPLSTFFSIWFDRLVPLLGRFAADPEAYTYLPKSVKRFPDPEALGGALQRAGLSDVRWILTAGGIIALHSGTVALMASAEAVAAVIEAGGAHVPELLDRLEAAPRGGRGVARPVLGRARRRDDLGGRQAAAAAARVRGGRAARGRRRAGCCAPRSRSSSSIRPRSSTTTSSTARSCAAAARRWSRPRAASWRPPPATCCSRARSPSWPPTAASDEIRVLSAASSALAEGELMQRADAWNVGDVARALPRPLRPQDRAAVRGRVRAGRARGRRAGGRCWAASGAASGSPSSCSTTCSTSQARRSARASTAARTCSTAR